MTKRRIRAEPTRRWTAIEEELVRLQYPHMSTKAIAAMLGCTLARVYVKARKLGLVKSEEYLASPAACRLRRGDEIGKPHRFPKGHVPANKGLRRPGWTAGRMQETQFRKGQLPRNWKPVGTTRVNADGYLDIKIDATAKGAMAWTAVHRLNWVGAHGPIPPGHVVAFREGNKRNCALENLELRTLAQNMKRNTVHNLPKPLVEIVQLRGALIRQINRRTRRDQQN